MKIRKVFEVSLWCLFLLPLIPTPSEAGVKNKSNNNALMNNENINKLIGLAIISDDESCVRIPINDDYMGSNITLVSIDEPNARQSVITAIIDHSLDRPVGLCKQLNNAGIDGPYYSLKQFSHIPKFPNLSIAVIGAKNIRSLQKDKIALEVNEKYSNLQFRLCTSREGFHITVWNGEPLKSERVWHTYFHLDYDTEPSCNDADF